MVTMLNAVADAQVFACSEASTIGGELLELCRRLRWHRRPVVILGGSAELSGLDPRWTTW